MTGVEVGREQDHSTKYNYFRDLHPKPAMYSRLHVSAAYLLPKSHITWISHMTSDSIMRFGKWPLPSANCLLKTMPLKHTYK